MTTIAFPAVPWQAVVKPRKLRFGQDLVPPAGGVMQRIARLGARWEFTVTLPRLDQISAQAWIRAQARSDSEMLPVSLALPKLVGSGSLGTPIVNGAGQTGTTLNANGFLPHSTSFDTMRFFSVSVGGRRYLYASASSIVVDGSGNAAINVTPMLRASPLNNAPLDFATPTVDGWITSDVAWDEDALTTYGITFTLQEAA